MPLPPLRDTTARHARAMPARSYGIGAIALHPWTHLFIILAALLFCYAPTLGNYFLADDIGEVNYVSQIVAGKWNLFWSNFTGNYMQIPGMAVYRPWFLVTILLDYLLWQNDAAGYYVTNLLHFFGCAVLLYFLVRNLARSWPGTRATLTALFTTLIFAVFPLHAESISWMVGRVDVVCLMYFLLSLLLLTRFLQRGKAGWLFGSLLAFGVAISTKEMAIGLPVLAVFIAYCWGNYAGRHRAPMASSGERPGWYLRLFVRSCLRHRTVLTVGAGFSLATVVYFLIRYFALGTFVGGYEGSIGAGQSAQFLDKWTDFDTLKRIVLPLNRSMFGEHTLLAALLLVTYSCAAFVGLVPRLRHGLPLAWAGLLFVWTIVCLVPIYRLWGLTDDLEGSRFVFFLTVPLSMLFPVLLFAPPGTPNTEGGPGSARSAPIRSGLGVPATILAVLVIQFAFIARQNNLPWIRAGDQVRALQAQAVQIGTQLGANQAAALLGLPKTRNGAHLILNGATFNMLVSPPFSQFQLQNKFRTFDPMMFGDATSINLHHFEHANSDPGVAIFLRWDSLVREFVPFDPGKVTVAGEPIRVSLKERARDEKEKHPAPALPVVSRFRTLDNGEYVEIGIADINASPGRIDFLELELHGVPAEKFRQGPARLVWQASDGESEVMRASFSIHEGTDSLTVRTPLSRFWQWHVFGMIRNLTVTLPLLRFSDIDQIQLVSRYLLAPDISVGGHVLTNRGSYDIDRTSGVSVETDCRRVKSSETVALEVYNPNFFVDDVGTQALAGAIRERLIARARHKRFVLDTASLPASSYVQIAAQCLDKLNQPVGEYSAPVTLYVKN